MDPPKSFSSSSSSSSSLILHSISSIFCWFFFGFTVIFSLFSLLLFFLRLKPYCNCEICKSYIKKTWTKDFTNLCDWYTHLLKKSPNGCIQIHVLNNIITSNPENVEYILKTHFENYPKGKPFSVILGDLLGNGIFNVDGDSWRFQRKMASLELGSLSIRMHAFELISDEIKTRLIPLLSSISSSDEQIGRILDLQDVFRRFSFDNICKFSFGLDPGCLKLSMPMSEFATAFDTASCLSAERAMSASPIMWKSKRLFNIGSEKKLKEAIKVVHELAGEVINHRRKEGFSNHKDLLSRFMGSIEDDKYLRDIVVSFLLAGRDTVASGLTSFFWLLSQNPRVQSAIRDESDRVIGPSDEKKVSSFEKLNKLHYLNAAVYESLRLFPPVQFDSKFAQEDDVLPDGTFVTKGTRVTYHQYAMGRMDRVWGPDCSEFKPERWLKNGVFVPENPFKYPVFQAGFRVCLGKEMALVEIKSVALAIIRAFNVQVADPNQPPRFSPGLTATVRGGLPVLIDKWKPSKSHQS